MCIDVFVLRFSNIFDRFLDNFYVRAKAPAWCAVLSSLWLARIIVKNTQARGLIILHTRLEPWRERRERVCSTIFI